MQPPKPLAFSLGALSNQPDAFGVQVSIAERRENEKKLGRGRGRPKWAGKQNSSKFDEIPCLSCLRLLLFEPKLTEDPLFPRDHSDH